MRKRPISRPGAIFEKKPKIRPSLGRLNEVKRIIFPKEGRLGESLMLTALAGGLEVSHWRNGLVAIVQLFIFYVDGVSPF
ncbi:hypothetical protein CEXT_507311 [Caerostris extrusa]|uniref:Uncharacterized protein n=1 Tax=Caerostris extrusa TaxID=172846 RepID=A0AAV4M7N8_CAEEX|nr:hypothetical protein CEXT_507311 [Caerostris extrusa]